MPDDERDASAPTDRDLILANRNLVIAVLEAVNALAVRLTGEAMVIGVGDPTSADWIRIGYSPSTVSWRAPMSGERDQPLFSSKAAA
jgi:hypothetical protein